MIILGDATSQAQSDLQRPIITQQALVGNRRAVVLVQPEIGGDQELQRLVTGGWLILGVSSAVRDVASSRSAVVRIRGV